MKQTIEVDVYLVSIDESVIVFPSGFVGVKMAVAVSEDPAYNISAWYTNSNQIKEMQALDKKNREERERIKLCQK